MQRYIAIGISLPRNVLSQIDGERGDIPRSRYILRILQGIYQTDAFTEGQQQTGPRHQPVALSDTPVRRSVSNQPKGVSEID
jgi:hypothetical protein